MAQADAVKKPAGRIAYTDALRILGAIAVVILHVSDDGMEAYDSLTHREWWFCALLNRSMRWAVPIFIMVSGALLLGSEREESLKQFYTRRLKRIGIPFLFWSVFYILWHVYYLQDGITRNKILEDLTHGGAYYHLHFLYTLLGLYLFVPMLRIFIRNAAPGMVQAATFLALALACADQVLRAQDHVELTIFTQFAPFLGYFLAGYCLRKWVCSWKQALVICVLLVLSIVTMTVQSHRAVLSGEDVDNQFENIIDEFSLPCIVMSLSVYVLVARAFAGRVLSQRAQNALSAFGGATFGVYLLHPIFLDILSKYDIGYDWQGIWTGLPALILGDLAVSFAVVFVLQRIPYVKWIVGS